MLGRPAPLIAPRSPASMCRSPSAQSPNAQTPVKSPAHPHTSPSASRSPLSDGRDSWIASILSPDGISIAPMPDMKPAPGQYSVDRVESSSTKPKQPAFSFAKSPRQPTSNTGFAMSSSDAMEYSSFNTKKSFRNSRVKVQLPKETRADWLFGSVANDVFARKSDRFDNVGPGAYGNSIEGNLVKPSFNSRVRPASAGRTPPAKASQSPRTSSRTAVDA
eukprot:ANDGO_02690.mRNA.1 hypothetical protein